MRRRARSSGPRTARCATALARSADGRRPVRAEFEREIEAGSLYVGSPETVARKIAATAQALGIARFDMKYSAGTLAHGLMMRSIELYGREVIPRVRALAAAPERELAPAV